MWSPMMQNIYGSKELSRRMSAYILIFLNC
jgi:hypothetical protein